MFNIKTIFRLTRFLGAVFYCKSDRRSNDLTIEAQLRNLDDIWRWANRE